MKVIKAFIHQRRDVDFTHVPEAAGSIAKLTLER